METTASVPGQSHFHSLSFAGLIYYGEEIFWIMCVLCAFLWSHFGCRRRCYTQSCMPGELLAKKGRQCKNDAALAAHQMHNDEVAYESNDMISFMPKHGAAWFKAQSIAKAKLMDIVREQAKIGKVEDMVQSFLEVENCFQLVLDMKDYHDVIVHLSRQGEPAAAHRWLQRSMEVGFQPLPGAFSSVISSYGKSGAIAQAMGVVEDMKSAGVEANTVTYNAIMHAWAVTGDAGKVQTWMQNLLDSGLKPSVVSFSIVLSACAAASSLEDTDAWFKLSQDFGFELNAITFHSVVNAFTRNGDAANAIKWVQTMVEHSVEPDIRCCMAVLTCLFEANDIDSVDALIYHMRAAGVQPDGGFYCRCITFAAKGGHNIKAQRWVDECVAAKCTLAPAAARAITEAGLNFPSFRQGDRARFADGQANLSTGPGDALLHMNNFEKEAQGKGIESIENRRAARMAAIGKRYLGTIKDYVPGQFGYITCAGVHDLFHRDVFLGRYDNPEELTKGQRVSFTLRVGEPYDLPRAAEVCAVRSFT